MESMTRIRSLLILSDKYSLMSFNFWLLHKNIIKKWRRKKKRDPIKARDNFRKTSLSMPRWMKQERKHNRTCNVNALLVLESNASDITIKCHSPVTFGILTDFFWVCDIFNPMTMTDKQMETIKCWLLVWFSISSFLPSSQQSTQ